MKRLPPLWAKMAFYLHMVANTYTEIFFFENYLLGLLLLAATFINPNVGFAGLLCVISAYELARFLGLKEVFRGSGYYTYNPLLVGLSIGFLFKFSVLTAFFVITGGLLTFIVTLSLAHIFYQFFRLPVTNLPFVFVSSIMYLAAYQYSNLLVNDFYLNHHFLDGLELQFPLWLTGLSKSLGSLLFSPHILGGLIFLLVLFLASRILFFLAVSGYGLGVIILTLMKGSSYQALTNLSAFNFSLIAMAIGGVFLIPSPRSYLLAAIAVAVSPFLLEASGFFSTHYGIPVFTLPFNIVTLFFLYALGLGEYPYLTQSYKGTPERTLDHYLSYQARFPGTLRTLALPFSGEWTVWQGFNGAWTHQGIWSYAVDFLINNSAGETFSEKGEFLENYFCFSKPVLAPVRGRIITVINAIEDNIPGQINEIDNWGNHVIIYDERGFYVLLAHFKQQSIKVAAGDWVESGHLLGLCGNSGYSPQPHLHIQIQFSAELGAATVPFSFLHYALLTEGHCRFIANDIPRQGALIQALHPEKGLKSRLLFVLDEEFKYNVTVNGKTTDDLRLKVCMAPDGTFYLNSGTAKLYFSRDHGTFYFLRLDGDSEILRSFFLALPRLPLTYKRHLKWHDNLPLETYFGRLRRAVLIFAASFKQDLARVTGNYKFVTPDTVSGEITGGGGTDKILTNLQLDPLKGISRLQITTAKKEIILRRV